VYWVSCRLCYYGEAVDDRQTEDSALRKQQFGAKAIIAAYPGKNTKHSTIKKICRRIDQTGSVNEHKAGSGRPRSGRTVTNIDHVGELISSQKGNDGQHSSSHEIAAELSISNRYVRRIAKEDLHLSAFRRVPAQVISEVAKQKRHVSVTSAQSSRRQADVLH